MSARAETKVLIARQVSLVEGRSWSQLSAASRIQYLTIAENILATVERKMSAESDRLANALTWDWHS